MLVLNAHTCKYILAPASVTLITIIRALESMKEAQMWMRYSNLNETKSVGFKKDITKQIEFLQDKVKLLLLVPTLTLTQVTAMTMEEIENIDNFGPHVSGCLAKPPLKVYILELGFNVLTLSYLTMTLNCNSKP